MMLGDYEEELMDVDQWSWYYLAECGKWHKFEDDPNTLRSEDIENYYMTNSRATFKIMSSSFDFSEMLQTDLNTGRQRRIQRSFNIQRSCSCFTTAPVFWEQVDTNCPYQLVPLRDLTPEYNTVADYVKKDGLLDKPIVSIYRIQNLDLWEMYCRKNMQLMRIQGVQEVQERRLFHGTDIRKVDSICKYNFDVRLAGAHGHTYGRGVYFAKHATYADKYSRGGTDPLPVYGGATGNTHTFTKIIFLARVMIGKSIVGQSHFLKPDHGISENTHNSCVDNISHPKIFVVFDSNQIYPEYLIQYT